MKKIILVGLFLFILASFVLGADVECKTDTNIEISIDVWNDSTTNITYVNVTVDTPSKDKVYINLTSGTHISKEVLNVDFTGTANFNDTVISSIVNETCADIKTHFGNLQDCEINKGKIQGELNNCNASYSLITTERDTVKKENDYLKTLPIQYPPQTQTASSSSSPWWVWLVGFIIVVGMIILIYVIVKKNRSPSDYYVSQNPSNPSNPGEEMGKKETLTNALINKHGAEIRPEYFKR